MSKRDIINKIADTHYQLAELYQTLASEQPVSSPAAAVEAGPPASTFDDTPLPPREEPTGDQGHDAICPKHRIAYTDGNYGPYCKQTTDDPAWGKQKGDTMWCRITPKNAADYLRIKAAA